MHDTLLRSISTTVTLLDKWPLLICCIDELSPTNPLIPSIALASRT